MITTRIIIINLGIIINIIIVIINLVTFLFLNTFPIVFKLIQRKWVDVFMFVVENYWNIAAYYCLASSYFEQNIFNRGF